MIRTIAKPPHHLGGIAKWILCILAMVSLVGVAIYSRSPDSTIAPIAGPQMAEHPVILPDQSTLYVQKYEVSIGEWNACHAAGACSLALTPPKNKNPADVPATGLSYADAQEYLTWINHATKGAFRLPTIAEWEVMAAEVMPPEPDPIFTDPSLSWASAYLLTPQTKRTLRTRGSFDTTSHGIVDLNGSVWEWTQDCYAGDGGAQVSGDRCPAFYVGGEHTAAIPFLVRDPARGGCAVGSPPAHLGLRLVTNRQS